MVKYLQEETTGNPIFMDRSSALTRIGITFVTLLLISAESVEKDQYQYRRRIKLLLIIILFSEISAFICQLLYKPLTQQNIRKIGVELIYMILNCSIIYHINVFLGKHPKTLSRIFYGAGLLIICTGILPYDTFGRLTYAANTIVSFYTLIILYRLKKYFNNLSKSSFKLLVIIPISHIALFRLEIIIFLFNLIDYLISLYYGTKSYKGWHIVHQMSTCISLMYLIKIYIVVVEWRSNNNNVVHINKNKKNENKQNASNNTNDNDQIIDNGSNVVNNNKDVVVSMINKQPVSSTSIYNFAKK